MLEDDELFAHTLEDFLTDEGFEVDLAHDGEVLIDKSYEKDYDILLLDINVPKINGLQALEHIRKNNTQTPAIFLTSFKDKDHLQNGFQKGADDYIKKPVDLDELLLRILAVLKRSNKIEQNILIGDILYDKQRCSLTIDQKEHFLSDKKVCLLELLIENHGKIVTKEMIHDKLWSWQEEPSESALRVYISSLKKLLGKDKLINIKGIGYRLEL